MRQKLLLLLALFFSFSQVISAQSNREEIALGWLDKNKEVLEIQPEHDFEMLFSRQGLSGETFRYYQMLNGVQVFDAEVTIHVSNNDIVTFHSSSYDKTVEVIDTNPAFNVDEAFQKAAVALNIQGDVYQKETKLYVYNKLDFTKLVYRVLTKSEGLNGYWETIVDAQSGEIISTKDISLFHEGKKKDKKKKASSSASMATGTAMVFDTDPLTATTSAYGGEYQDNNDATNASLDAARIQVNLPEIELVGGTYKLKGTYVEIADVEAPTTGLFTQASSDFHFTRDQQGFEAANVYYHLDKSMRYVNVDLGITLVSLFNGGVLRYDPHGWNGADNSSYGGGTLSFGEGCVDDAEDADVILHELGHGLHDWVTNGSLSNDIQGLSEGCGDYWANSYKRSLGLWGAGDAARNWVFGWDGHNACWNGRTTVYPNLYPGGLGAGYHNNGQIWASALMEIWEIIGREKTDKAFLEGLGMTNSSTNQEQAAIAVRQAAIDMGTAHGFTCADIQAMTDRFTARGYTLPAYTCNLSVDEFAANTISIFPNPTNGIITFKNITQEYDVTIFNMLGQNMKSQSVDSSSNSLDVSNLATGTYFVKFKGYEKVLKFIKL